MPVGPGQAASNLTRFTRLFLGANQTDRLLGKELRTWARLSCRLSTTSPTASSPCIWNTDFAISKPVVTLLGPWLSPPAQRELLLPPRWRSSGSGRRSRLPEGRGRIRPAPRLRSRSRGLMQAGRRAAPPVSLRMPAPSAGIHRSPADRNDGKPSREHRQQHLHGPTSARFGFGRKSVGRITPAKSFRGRLAVYSERIARPSPSSLVIRPAGLNT